MAKQMMIKHRAIFDPQEDGKGNIDVSPSDDYIAKAEGDYPLKIEIINGT